MGLEKSDEYIRLTGELAVTAERLAAARVEQAKLYLDLEHARKQTSKIEDACSKKGAEASKFENELCHLAARIAKLNQK